MKSQLILIALLLLTLGACSGPQTAVVTEVPVSTAPMWVTSRPVSSMYYTGIGRARKGTDVLNYQQVARANALDDLAGEIEVKVSSNSLLYTLEHDDRFSESFNQGIQTSTDLTLTEYEVVDSYEDTDYLWLYYRLDKSRYASYIAQQKQKALTQAAEQLKLARVSRGEAQIEAAASQYVAAIEALSPYWGELNEYDMSASGTDPAERITLDATALKELSDMRSNFTLSEVPLLVELTQQNQFRYDYTLSAQLDGQSLKDLPYAYCFGKEDLTKLRTEHLRIELSPAQARLGYLSITVDPFTELRDRLHSQKLSFLNPVLSPLTQVTDLRVIYPKVRVEAEQWGIGGGRGASPILRSAMVSELSKIGIEVDESGQSPYLIRLEATAREGGLSQTFQVVYIDLQVKALNSQQSSTYYQETIDAIKGVHKTPINAQAKALQKSAERIDKNLINNLIEAMF